MANLTAEQYDTLQEMLKVITEARQTSERLSESWAKGLANPIGPHKTHISSPITPMTPSQSNQPPDPPDYKPNLISKSIANKKFPLRYSGEEIYERMEIGLCIFCDDQDIPGHYQLKHKRSQIFMIECEDDKEEVHQIQETVMIPEKTADYVPDVFMVYKVDSHVKEVEESPQQSTNSNDKNVAHQVFAQMPLGVTSKEKQRKSLKAWKFKFKISFKRSKLMGDMFSVMKETGLLNKDPKETIWDCVKKEFKETMAACAKKRVDRFKLVDEKESRPGVLDLNQTFMYHQIDHGVDMLLVPKMLVHDKEMVVLPQRSTSLMICDCPHRLSRANHVWKPGGLLCVQDHSGGSILKITQRFHGLRLQRIIYMDMKVQEVIVDYVLSVTVCLIFHNMKFEAELEIYISYRCLVIKKFSWFKKLHEMSVQENSEIVISLAKETQDWLVNAWLKTQVLSGFDLKALIGLEIYSWEYKKQRRLEKSPFQYTYAAQIKRCGETTRQIDFFTDQMSKIRVLVKQMLLKENDIYLDIVEASEFFSSAHGSDMAPQREIKSQQASEDLLESPLLQEEKSIDSIKQIIIWIIFKELCSAGLERGNETIKKSFKGLSKVEKDHKIEATVLVFLRYIFGIEHKITNGWIKYQEQGAKYEWSLFLQALQAVKDHKNTNYVTNTAILGVKRKYDPHGRLKEDMSLGSLTQKHHNKWGILTGTEIFSYNGVIIQVMVQRQWETFVMMLLSIAESLILLSDPFILAEKKGIEISISCCYGTSSVDMQFSTAFEIMSKQQHFIQLPNLPRESSHDDADRILQKREGHITSSERNVAVTKALIQWKEHPPDQIKDSQMYVLVSENQCQDYSPLLFVERVKDRFEIMLMVEHFENPLVSILTQEVFHLQRPPELIDLHGNLDFITKVIVHWKEHPPDQFSQAFMGKYSCFHP